MGSIIVLHFQCYNVYEYCFCSNGIKFPPTMVDFELYILILLSFCSINFTQFCSKIAHFKDYNVNLTISNDWYYSKHNFHNLQIGFERKQNIISKITSFYKNSKIAFWIYSNNPLNLHINLDDNHFQVDFVIIRTFDIWKSIFLANYTSFFVFSSVILFKQLIITEIHYIIFRRITHFLLQ